MITEKENSGTVGCSARYFQILCLLTMLAVILVISTNKNLVILAPTISGTKLQQEMSISTWPASNSAGIITSTQATQTEGKILDKESSSTSQGTPTLGTHKLHSGEGYWLATHFSDQGTGSFINLMSLLCLAKAIGVRVVEPFMYGSNLGQNVSANWRKEIAFREIFNVDEFHKYSTSKHFGTLVPYLTFLEDAPRKLIVAQYKCSGFHVCRTCRHRDVIERGKIFARMNGLEMVGVICLEYDKEGRITTEELNRQLYNKYKKSELVVIFLPIYGGIENSGFRLNLSPSHCARHDVRDAFRYIKPSKLVESCADKYKELYLGDDHYMTVMVRFEMVLSRRFTSEAINVCLTNLHNKIQDLKSKFKISKVALCLDAGKYGSVFFREEDPSKLVILTPHLNKFISSAVKEGMNLTDLDETFSKATVKQNPGFVAMMQKILASRGDVLVLLGGHSSYQASTKKMYSELHRKRDVVMLDDSCG